MSETDPRPFPWLFHTYRLCARLFAPLIHRFGMRKLQRAGVAKHRLSERSGQTSKDRPIGRLIWVHAVSVGETLSILDVLKELRIQDPRLTILLTTTTATAAELAEQRLPEGCIHQFAPLDTPQAVDAFLNHWQPDMVSFVESEIWPNQIAGVFARDIPMALINARLSKKSLASWAKRKPLAEALFDRFSMVLCQTDFVRDGLRDFVSAPWKVITSGDLKKSSDPLPVNDLECARLKAAIGKRPLWLASSTHKGEEELIAAAHQHFKDAHEKALLVLLPRHPNRGDEVESLLKAQGFTVARRSRSEEITATTDVYLADTLGETGLFYALSELVFVAGSFVEVGGHNPYEPAHFDCAILHGPNVANFAQAYADMAEQDACVAVEDQDALGQQLVALWGDDEVDLLKFNARHYIQTGQNIRKDIAGHLLNLMPQRQR